MHITLTEKAQESIVLMKIYDLLAFVGAYGTDAVLHYQILRTKDGFMSSVTQYLQLFI